MKGGASHKKERKLSENKITQLYSRIKNNTNKNKSYRQGTKLTSKSHSQSFNLNLRYQKQSKDHTHTKNISNSNLQSIDKNQFKQGKTQIKRISSSLNQFQLVQNKQKDNLNKKIYKNAKQIQKGPFYLPGRSLDRKNLNLSEKKTKQNRSISHLNFQAKGGDSILRKQNKLINRKIILSELSVRQKDAYLKKSNRQNSVQNKKNSCLEEQIKINKEFRYKYSYRTRKGQQANNPKKVNQDSLLVKQNICKLGIQLFAVADGHGHYGHLISQHVIKSLSKLVSQQILFLTKENQINKNHNKSQNIQIHQILPKIYDQIQDQLTCSDINASLSGTTLVNVIISNNNILCANVGDSRAILARQIDKKNWEVIYLSQDHKPDIQSEKKRIMKKGGRVHPYRDLSGQALGPARVWLPNQNIQGLAMSRSFGDNISKSIGVIHNPEMIKVALDENSKFLLLASDGVWQFISNQQILQLIVPYYRQNKLEQASDALLKLAYERWTVQDDSVVDDITFVLIFFQ